ncbi:MAG: hypothetical protein J6Y69_11360 [Treponema sp.]|nr:hypothetical protein [Treponema sp.]
MPVKLIGAVILAVFVAIFTGFNLTNKCDVWLFHTFKDVPVAATIIGSFVLGVFVTLPFTFIKRSGKEGKKSKASKKNEGSSPSNVPPIHSSSGSDSISIPPATVNDDPREEVQDDPVD